MLLRVQSDAIQPSLEIVIGKESPSWQGRSIMDGANQQAAAAPKSQVPMVGAATPSNINSPDKAQLECEKLQAEIEDIRKPVWKKTAFYASTAPVALAVLGLIFTWGTGWFDVQRTRISNDKTLLEAQTERLRTERTVLESQAKDQQARIAHAEQEISNLRQRESDLTNQLAKLSVEREELRLAKEVLQTETKRLAGSDTKALQLLQQLKSIQETREQLSTNLQKLETSNATLLATTARQAALIRWANEVLSEGWRIALKDKGTWAKFRDFGGHVLNIHVASMNYLPEWEVLPDVRAALDERPTRTYEDDSQTEQHKALIRATTKTYEDYIREAEENYELLNGVLPSGHTNQNRGTGQTTNDVPSRNSLR